MQQNLLPVLLDVKGTIIRLSVPYRGGAGLTPMVSLEIFMQAFSDESGFHPARHAEVYLNNDLVRQLRIALQDRELPEETNQQPEVTKMKLDVYDIARVCHEVNRAYCQAMGDESQPKWADAPSWQRESAMLGVRMHLENPDATPEQSHESWLRQKEKDGWRYGDTKDPERKLHPCFLPYDQLPQAQRAKDYLFKAVVTELSKL